MNPISMILLAINGLSTVLSNPALGGGSSVRMGEASELLALLNMLIQEGDDGYDDLKAFTDVIESMVVQGRSPTPTEWLGIRARSEDAHARLQAVKDELLGEVEDPSAPAPDPDPAPDSGEPVADAGDSEDPTTEPAPV